MELPRIVEYVSIVKARHMITMRHARLIRAEHLTIAMISLLDAIVDFFDP
jgi:hypothetical protein